MPLTFFVGYVASHSVRPWKEPPVPVPQDGALPDRPLRHQEYLAMAEEVQRLRMENEQLTAPRRDGQVSQRHYNIVMAIAIVALSVFSTVASVLILKDLKVI